MTVTFSPYYRGHRRLIQPVAVKSITGDGWQRTGRETPDGYPVFAYGDNAEMWSTNRGWTIQVNTPAGNAIEFQVDLFEPFASITRRVRDILSDEAGELFVYVVDNDPDEIPFDGWPVPYDDGEADDYGLLPEG